MISFAIKCVHSSTTVQARQLPCIQVQNIYLYFCRNFSVVIRTLIGPSAGWN